MSTWLVTYEVQGPDRPTVQRDAEMIAGLYGLRLARIQSDASAKLEAEELAIREKRWRRESDA